MSKFQTNTEAIFQQSSQIKIFLLKNVHFKQQKPNSMILLIYMIQNTQTSPQKNNQTICHELNLAFVNCQIGQQIYTFVRMAQMIDTHSLHDLLHWTLLSLDSHILNYFVSMITPFFNIQLDLTSRITQALIYFYDIRSKQEHEDFETITQHLSSQAWIISQQLHSSLAILISNLHFKQEMSKIISYNQQSLILEMEGIIKVQQKQPFYESLNMQTDQATPKLENIIQVNLFNDNQPQNHQTKTSEERQEQIDQQQQQSTDIICFCQDPKRAISRNNKLYQCNRCQRIYHRLCMKSNSICPYCQLQSQNPTEKIQYCVALIYQSKQLAQTQTLFYVGNMKRNEKLSCRSVRIDRLGNNKSSFPQNFSLYINNQQVYTHTNVLQQNKAKQKCIQIPRLSIYSQNNNSIIINTDGVFYNLRKEKKNSQNYLIGLFITQNNNNAHPIKEIIDKNYFSASESLLLQKRCWEDNDLYYTLEYSTFKFSAICPSRKKAMIIPARGKNCSHYSCFDLVFFVQTSSKKAKDTWLCPICNQSASEIVVDSFIQSIILSKQRSPALAEIRFLSSGYFTLIDLTGNQIEKNKISDVQIIDKKVVMQKVYEIINSYEEEGIYIG